jgi:membrane fusion protein, multidrug efflux system
VSRSPWWRPAILAATVLALAACAKTEVPPPPLRPVALAQVAAGSGDETAVFAGEVKPRYESDLAFRIGGKIVARGVDAGARVKKGQALARLDPADVGLQADAARAQVAAAKTEYEFAQAEFERYQGLLAQKFVSASALDAKRNTMTANLAKFEQAKANLAVATNQAAYATLVAPEDGVITSVGAEAGQVVAAGQPVMRYAREGEREVAIAVPEARLGELAAAKEILVVLVADPKKLYRGRVREVSPAVDPATRTFGVRIAIADPAPALRWGMTANVVLARDGAAGSMLLPAASLYQSVDGRPAVWVYDPAAGKVVLRPVVIRQYREDGIVVASGVAVGEWVVASGANKLHDGEAVRPYEAAGRPAPAAAAAPGAQH